MKEKSYLRIEIPQRIEQNQLIGKIAELPFEQFLEYYKDMLKIFNLDVINEIIESEKATNK